MDDPTLPPAAPSTTSISDEMARRLDTLEGDVRGLKRSATKRETPPAPVEPAAPVAPRSRLTFFDGDGDE